MALKCQSHFESYTYYTHILKLEMAHIPNFNWKIWSQYHKKIDDQYNEWQIPIGAFKGKWYIRILNIWSRTSENIVYKMLCSSDSTL